MSDGELLVTTADGVTVMTLNRPERLNAITLSMRQQMFDVFREVDTNPATRVLVVTGAGRAFCAGAEIERLNRFSDSLQPPEERKKKSLLPERSWSVGLAVSQVRKPTIAAINGACVGGGLDLAAWCDFRIASDKATLGEVHIKRALIPHSTCYILPRLVGLTRAMDLLLLGTNINAREAERIGLVNRVVPHESLMQEATALARQIAEGPQLAQVLTKRAIYKALDSDVLSVMEFVSYARSVVARTDEVAEAVQAFKEKRRPHFSTVV
ncbi:MAG: enoyl-CoA hydratase/isomerase family protein [Chloroflexi bacterium]|nr:enoyl-CoA hydratase/isomerase family protein [Chloroflexota bacterium]